MKKLNPHSIPLESINLIEASAGTGKSWTVTLLYLRLILEKNLTVDQILVVTFTDAATKELRDDIRKRLIDALKAFEGAPYDKNDEYSRLIQSSIDKEEAIRKLKQAKLSLDEAAIFTIHGFCQRALTEKAFEAGLPFESELIDDDSELLQKLTDDFWRLHFINAPAPFLFVLQKKSITPDSLLHDIQDVVGKPYLKLCKPEVVSDDLWKKLEALFLRVKDTWCNEEDEIQYLLCNPAREAEYNKNFVKARDFILEEMSLIKMTGSMPISLVSKHNWLGTKDKTTAKFEPLDHPFFYQWQEFLDLWNTLDKKAADYINQIRIELIDYLRVKLPQEKKRLGVFSFDDLLLNLQSTFKKNHHLAADLRQKYQAALIDEFQDTDPIQYDIFRTIYSRKNNNAVFLVGDPKQAIYSFRGGDIHTYLKAKSDTPSDNHYTLTRNWRSHPDLIKALNDLFSCSQNPFQNKHINYIEVDSGDINTAQMFTPDNRKPLRFWRYVPYEEKPLVGMIRKEISDAVAGDIAELLTAAANGKAKIGEQNISGGDIAILVRDHAQGDLIKQALNSRGVASVQRGKNNIFETKEATELGYLLTAIANPRREDNIRRALVTEIMGFDANTLLNLEKNESDWGNILQLIQEWNFQWKREGFLPMMRSLMHSQNIHQHLLSFENGERRITNLLHLSELIHQQIHEQSLSVEEVLHWLKEQQKLGIKQAELRLESDERLVKIVTIHASKGLEYPIVYCPFVGMKDERSVSGLFIFNDEQEAYLEAGSIDYNTHKVLKEQDDQAENMRLLYVALTRAKYHCTVVSFDQVLSGSNHSALSRLLVGHYQYTNVTKKITDEALEENQCYEEAYKNTIESLSQQKHTDVTDIPHFDDGIYYQSEDINKTLLARYFSTEIKPQAQITSFSGLTAGSHDEIPDHDAHQEIPEIVPTIKEEFPRGATAGSALHEMFEYLDFTKAISDQSIIVSDALRKWGFSDEYQLSAKKLLENSLTAELCDGLRLKDLNNIQCLNEMEFYLPLEKLQINDLQQILFQYLPEQWQVVRNAISVLDFAQVEGYLKGFIDLIFEYKGQYYVADYKSNTLVNYQYDGLLSVIADSHYYLQYLLYSVALHRYLKKRLSGYQWETHFGGVYYLFIRGMKATTKEPSKSGVFFDKPSFDLIEALDALFMEPKL